MSLTPMMQQYSDAKQQAPDALLLFRMGDFFETFDEDAEEAARRLGLTLTSRDKERKMAGFPHHALEGHLKTLLEQGRKVAICDQVEDPKQAMGLVKREITRIVTPGTLTEQQLLDPRTANILAAIAPPSRPGGLFGLAWVDASRGVVTVTKLLAHQVAHELARLEPAECLLPEGKASDPAWIAPLAREPVFSYRPAYTFKPQEAGPLLRGHFGVATFAGFGVDDESPGIAAAGALLAYLRETQRTNLRHVSRLVPYEAGVIMTLDAVTRRSLELTRTLRENRRQGSLLDTIDLTTSSAGARLLAEWLAQPLIDLATIKYRQDAVSEWKDDPSSRRDLRELVRRSYDVERLVTRISSGRCSPRDLQGLRETLVLLPALKAKLNGRFAKANADLEEALELFIDVRDRLDRTLADEPPQQMKDGGMIRPGFHAELDELRELARGGKQFLVDLQQREAARLGIPNLKVSYNKVFGYYLEVPHSGRDKVPAEWTRRQTVKNAERYITEELKEYEEKVLGAEDRARTFEQELFLELREAVAAETVRLQRLAHVIAVLDVYLSLAELASVRNYVRPVVVDEAIIEIEAGRHPVLDAHLPAGTFVANDTHMAADGKRVVLITGPNMAGKSTYIRQVALILLLAQTGSFVPAAKATLGVADRIFTRVGASDELSRGQSTFMVEMTETANILNNATARSLVILDEIGRGTSTYDGVSLAWAITEHLHDHVGCRTLFATHYHELIALEEKLPHLGNLNVAIREWNEDVIFLHQLVAGGADRSYGIHVARLAGVPANVLARAQTILQQLESDPFGEKSRVGQPKKHRRRTYHQLSLFPLSTAHPILDAVRLAHAERLTGDQAIRLILEWQDQLRQDGDEG